jgi:PAS domain-containing protein
MAVTEGVGVDEGRAGPDLQPVGRETVRLRWVTSASDGLSDVEILPFALDQAVAALGGLGGLAHRSGGADRRLRLAAISGLPRDLAVPWEDVGWDEAAAPARAVREGRFVWSPVDGPDGPDGDPDGGHGRAGGGADGPARGFPEGTGLAVVPLPGADGPLGTLSILTSRPGPPTPQEEEFLVHLADRVGGRLQQARFDSGIITPTWWQEPSGSHLFQAMRAISVGAWDWDMRTGRLIADDAALNAVGLRRETFDERVESWSALVHPDDAAGVFAEIDRAVADRNAYSLEYRVSRPDGDVAWIEARGYVTFGDDGEPLRMTGTLWETTETRTARDAASRALQHMSDGFLAVDDQWRILYCNAQAERILGTGRRLLGRVLWEAVPDARAFGLEERYRRAAVDRSPIGFDVQAPADRHWYHTRLVPVPGGLTVYFTDITEQRARKAEQARAEQASAQRTARIGELTEALAQALTARDVVGAMADRVLPLFGATGLQLSALEGNRVHMVGLTGYPQRFGDRFEGMTLEAVGPINDVLKERAPKFIESVEAFTARYPHLAHLPAEGGKRAWAFLPLIASGRPIGCCTISFDRPRSLSSEERTLLVALSGLVAHALERARLYDAEHSRAQELQRGMLPQRLPALPAVTTAARYVPAGAGMEVGGDWYDVIPLSAERVALVIGDVMGHGLSEAVTMGRLRTAVHTLADLEIPPGELLARLDSLVTDLGDAAYATCLYAVYDPTNRTLSFASAGHPPPAVLHPDGSVRFPELDPDPPLGAASPPFATVDLRLPEESLVVLYTDGLIESPGSDIDDDMARLARTLAAALPHPPHLTAAGLPWSEAGDADDDGRLDSLCDTLTATLLPGGGQADDDAAVLVARTHVLDPEDMASWPLPEEPVAAGQARKCVRTQLAKWGMDELVTTTELLASELVGNVVRHAKGPVQLRLLRGRTLICEVSDGSLTTPRIRHASETDEGGRGLQLVAALAHRWGARYTTTGKCIWTEQLHPPVRL